LALFFPPLFSLLPSPSASFLQVEMLKPAMRRVAMLMMRRRDVLITQVNTMPPPVSEEEETAREGKKAKLGLT